MAPGERSEEVWLWYTAVYEAIQEVPSGKVTSYGHIARLRVINAKGGISPRGPSAAAQQADALRREGVEVRQDAMGQYTVDLGTYGWFPDVLPSEAGLVESSDEEDEEAAAYHT
ncbi:hypothetical protein J4E86_003501 [Alternaria arbusti]|uniref:uncharacterized protein n=1 Tax=Alternaria arbusti TaxID=232088 RepID=UPI002220396F|nr:uncharacterized protein J4E86_003501 [Alternaria arbusti]KAI4959776.1 hypothetical protein J4E86_003501 [Alternaria arbusti]